MKNVSLLALVSTLALAALNATATSLSFVGPVTIDWTVYQQGSSTTSSNKTHTSKSTNVVFMYKGTFTSSSFANADLLKLLENSFNTTFPKLTRLATDGYALYVVDKTGSNIVLDISSVVSVQFQNSVYKYNETDSQTMKGSTSTYSDMYSDPEEISYVALQYNDSSKTTADGTHTVFAFDGLSTSQYSGTEATGTAGKSQTSFKLPGAGNGTIHGINSVVGGTVSGSATGTGD